MEFASTVGELITLSVVTGRTVVISVGLKPMVVLVQRSPTCPHALLATKELKAIYTLGEVKVKPAELTLVVASPGAGGVGVA